MLILVITFLTKVTIKVQSSACAPQFKWTGHDLRRLLDVQPARKEESVILKSRLIVINL